METSAPASLTRLSILSCYWWQLQQVISLSSNFHEIFFNNFHEIFFYNLQSSQGLHQWRLYKRFSTPVDTSNIRPSTLFIFQIIFQLSLPLVSGGQCVVSVWGYHDQWSGVTVFTLVTMILCWSVSSVLTSLERYRQLPISARHGHGPGKINQSEQSIVND